MPDDHVPETENLAESAQPVNDRICAMTMQGLSEEEKNRLIRHMALEEEREKAQEAKFVIGERRMDAIEKDLRPLRALYYAVAGSGVVAAMLLSALLYIYGADKADLKEMQQAIYKQGTVMEKMIQAHQELEKDFRRESDRLERGQEKIINRLDARRP